MTNSVVQSKTESSKLSTDESNKGIESHKLAASHLQAAAKHHLDAAKHLEAGEHEKAAASSVKAYGEEILAHEITKQDAKNHVSKN